MKICLKYEQFLEKMSMEDLISINYSKLQISIQKYVI